MLLGTCLKITDLLHASSVQLSEISADCQATCPILLQTTSKHPSENTFTRELGLVGALDSAGINLESR